MPLGTPSYTSSGGSIDTDATLGPTSGIISASTALGAVGTNQGNQLGITKNLINTLIAVETIVGTSGSAVTTTHDNRIVTLENCTGTGPTKGGLDANNPSTMNAWAWMKDEFTTSGYATNNGIQGELGWVLTAANNGQSGFDSAFSHITPWKAIGVQFLQSNTVSASGAVCLSLKALAIANTFQQFDFTFRVMLSQLSTSAQAFNFFAGLCSVGNADTTGTSIGFEYSQAAGANLNFTMGTISGGAPTRVDLGTVAAANTPYVLRMQSSNVAWGNINLWINGTPLTPITTSIPDVSALGVFPAIRITKSVGLTNAISWIDTFVGGIQAAR